MVKIPSHLFQRNGTFYYRQKLPDLVKIIAGNGEIKKSLGTKDKDVAVFRALQIKMAVNQLLEMVDNMAKDGDKKVHADYTEIFKKVGDKEIQIKADYGDPEKEQAYVKEELKRFDEQFKDAPFRLSVDPVKPAKHAAAEVIKLSDLIQKFTDEKIKSGAWVQASQMEFRGIFDKLVFILGDMPVDEIGYEQARYFKEVLAQLPPNMNKDTRYRHLSLKKVLAIKNKSTLSIKTCNKILTLMGSLFDWAKRHGYTKENYFDKLTIKEKSWVQKVVKHFTPEEITKLFSTPQYTVPEFRFDYMYWCPLIGLYTGMRLEEICQLYLEDIREIDGIWCFDIKVEGDRQLKRPASIRITPIHSKLIELGFLDYVQALRDKGKERLFDLRMSAKGKLHPRVSKWFNERYKVKLGITGPGKNFHSFRHTVANALKQKRYRESLVASITGHKVEGITFGTYADDYNIKIKKELIEALDFDLSMVQPYSERKGGAK